MDFPQQTNNNEANSFMNQSEGITCGGIKSKKSVKKKGASTYLNVFVRIWYGSGTYLKSAVSDMNTKHDLPRGALHQNSQAVKKLKNTDWNMGFLMARSGRFHISWAIIPSTLPATQAV